MNAMSSKGSNWNRSCSSSNWPEISRSGGNVFLMLLSERASSPHFTSFGGILAMNALLVLMKWIIGKDFSKQISKVSIDDTAALKKLDTESPMLSPPVQAFRRNSILHLFITIMESKDLITLGSAMHLCWWRLYRQNIIATADTCLLWCVEAFNSITIDPNQSSISWSKLEHFNTCNDWDLTFWFWSEWKMWFTSSENDSIRKLSSKRHSQRILLWPSRCMHKLSLLSSLSLNILSWIPSASMWGFDGEAVRRPAKL